MRRLIYSSVATTDFSDEELEALLGRSRRNNQADGLTGILLHVHSEPPGSAYFTQLLEGPDEAVGRRYELIAQDELHRAVMVLLDEPVDERSFGDWTMRLERVLLSHRPAEISGLVTDREYVERLLLSYA